MREANPDLGGGILQKETSIYLEEGQERLCFPSKH